MGTSELVAIVGLFLTYLSGLIGIYINLKVKMKELEVKIISIQGELTEHKIDTSKDIDKLIQSQKADILLLNNKLDLMLERIYELKNQIPK